MLGIYSFTSNASDRVQIIGDATSLMETNKEGSTFVSESYINTIQKEKSPYLGYNSQPSPFLVQLKKQNDSLFFFRIDDLNQVAVGFFEIDKTGNATRKYLGSIKSLPRKIEINSSTRFCLVFDRNSGINYLTGCYVYVDNVQKFVAANTIMGCYVDSNGQKYSFDKNGEGTFQNMSFKYHVSLTDYAVGEPEKRDRDINKLTITSNKIIPLGPGWLGFKVNNNQLLLWKSRRDIPGPDWWANFPDEPSHVLQKVKCAGQ